MEPVIRIMTSFILRADIDSKWRNQRDVATKWREDSAFQDSESHSSNNVEINHRHSLPMQVRAEG